MPWISFYPPSLCGLIDLLVSSKVNKSSVPLYLGCFLGSWEGFPLGIVVLLYGSIANFLVNPFNADLNF